MATSEVSRPGSPEMEPIKKIYEEILDHLNVNHTSTDPLPSIWSIKVQVQAMINKYGCTTGQDPEVANRISEIKEHNLKK